MNKYTSSISKNIGLCIFIYTSIYLARYKKYIYTTFIQIYTEYILQIYIYTYICAYYIACMYIDIYRYMYIGHLYGYIGVTASLLERTSTPLLSRAFSITRRGESRKVFWGPSACAFCLANRARVSLSVCLFVCLSLALAIRELR